MLQLLRWRLAVAGARTRRLSPLARASSEQSDARAHRAKLSSEQKVERYHRLQQGFKGMACPGDRKYTPSHFWCKQEGENHVKLGLTHKFLASLGEEVVEVEVAPNISYVNQGDELVFLFCDELTTTLYSPMSATVLEINAEMMFYPPIISEQPYGDGWIARLEVDDESKLKKLLSADEYERSFNPDAIDPSVQDLPPEEAHPKIEETTEKQA